MEDPFLAEEVESHVEEIHEYVMFQLHHEFFKFNNPSVDEVRFQQQVRLMYNIEAEAYGTLLSSEFNNEEMQQAWRVAIRQLAKIETQNTPRTKLLLIGKVIQIIQHSFELFRGEQLNADDLVTILPFLFVKAKISRLLAHIQFIEAFHYSVSDGDQVEVYLTNLKIVKQRIQGF